MKRPFKDIRPLGPFYQQDSGLQGPFIMNLDLMVLRKLNASSYDISTKSGKDKVRRLVEKDLNEKDMLSNPRDTSITFDASKDRVNVIFAAGSTVRYNEHLRPTLAYLDDVAYAVFAERDDVNIDEPFSTPTRKPPNMSVSIPVAFTKGEIGRNTLNTVGEFAAEKTEDDKSELIIDDSKHVRRFKQIRFTEYNFDTPPSSVTHRTKLNFQTNLSTIDLDFVSLLISNLQEAASNVNDTRKGFIDVQGQQLEYSSGKNTALFGSVEIEGK